MRQGLAAVQRAGLPPRLLSSGSHKPRKGRDRECLPSRQFFSAPPSVGHSAGKRAAWFGFRFGPESSFDLRGLSSLGYLFVEATLISYNFKCTYRKPGR
jgi:hypothetical protein